MKKSAIIIIVLIAFSCSKENGPGYVTHKPVKEGIAEFNYQPGCVNDKNGAMLAEFLQVVNNNFSLLEHSGKDAMEKFVRDSLMKLLQHVNFDQFLNNPVILEALSTPAEQWTPDFTNHVFIVLQNLGFQFPPLPGNGNLPDSLPCTDAYNLALDIAAVNFIINMSKASDAFLINPYIGIAMAADAIMNYYNSWTIAYTNWCHCMQSLYGGGC
ncbi:MAG: hypothetical protein NTW49_14305 [Bacteroidia bacterium]|nr:hypothetical protein [Bacteroidia bacterium]